MWWVSRTEIPIHTLTAALYTQVQRINMSTTNDDVIVNAEHYAAPACTV
jgi:hypothetical protein